jgi:hypothetical protein
LLDDECWLDVGLDRECESPIFSASDEGGAELDLRRRIVGEKEGNLPKTKEGDNCWDDRDVDIGRLWLEEAAEDADAPSKWGDLVISMIDY